MSVGTCAKQGNKNQTLQHVDGPHAINRRCKGQGTNLLQHPLQGRHNQIVTLTTTLVRHAAYGHAAILGIIAIANTCICRNICNKYISKIFMLIYIHMHDPIIIHMYIHLHSHMRMPVNVGMYMHEDMYIYMPK